MSDFDLTLTSAQWNDRGFRTLVKTLEEEGELIHVATSAYGNGKVLVQIADCTAKGEEAVDRALEEKLGHVFA